MALIGCCDPVSWQLFLNKSPSLVDNCQAPQVKWVKGFLERRGGKGGGLMVLSYDLFSISMHEYSSSLHLDLD